MIDFTVDAEELRKKIDDEFTELTSAVLSVLEEHEDRVRQVVVEHAERLIRSGKFEEAGDLLKEANQDSL